MVVMTMYKFNELVHLADEMLLALAKRADKLHQQGKCDETSMHHITNAVSSKKYGIEDVHKETSCDWMMEDITEIIFNKYNIVTIEE